MTEPTETKINEPVSQADEAKPKRNKFPAGLWALPILFGIIGGIIAAIVSAQRYKASWWELLVVGIVMIFLVGFWGVLGLIPMFLGAPWPLGPFWFGIF